MNKGTSVGEAPVGFLMRTRAGAARLQTQRKEEGQREDEQRGGDEDKSDVDFTDD